MDLAKVPLGDGYTPHEATHHDLNPSFTQPMRWFSDEESQSTDGEGFPDETEVRTREGHGQHRRAHDTGASPSIVQSSVRPDDGDSPSATTSQRHRAGISPIPIPWSGPIDNLDRFHRDRGLEPLGVQKAAHHFLWRIHASFFVSHWTSGTLSLQSGQITKWIRIISSVGAPVEMVDQSPSSTASHQDGHYALTRHCLARLRSVLKAPSRLGSGPRTVHDSSRLPSPWSGKLLDTTMAKAVSVALFAAGKMKICMCFGF